MAWGTAIDTLPIRGVPSPAQPVSTPLAYDSHPRPKDLGNGLDQKAIEAVRKWTFAPATNHGNPVSLRVTIEVTLRLR